MNKKFLIVLAVIASVIISAGLFAWNEFSSYRVISFDVRKQPINIKIVDKNNKTVTSFTNSTKVNLKDGTYKALPAGDNIDESEIPFTTTETNTTIIINPYISLEALNKSLTEEREDIVAVLMEKYPDIIAQFTIGRGQLLRQADWYITTLSYKNSSNNTPRDTYKVIMKKIDGIWTVIDKPQITPTKYNFPTVPIDILKSAYNLQKDTL